MTCSYKLASLVERGVVALRVVALRVVALRVVAHRLVAPGLVALQVVALGLAATPALAHHSFAMFDQKKTVVLEGTVLQFQWTNPHVWIQLKVSDPQGKPAEWGVECTSVNILKRQGWHHDSLHPGDRVKLVLRPLRDGSHGGQLAKLLEINGSPADLVSYR